MDARRLLILLSCSLLAAGCATLERFGVSAKPAGSPQLVADGARSQAPAPALETVSPPAAPTRFATMAPIPDPPAAGARRDRPSATSGSSRGATGRAAIAAANATARETSRSRGFVGGVQVFAYDPGRVYEVWTAPLRVTTLTLSPGETVTSKAAGDTVRWQIGETSSGEGPNQRAHVMIKPLQRGLETNLVLATNRRVYLLQLRSGAPEAFNAAVTWDVAAVLDAPDPAGSPAPEPQGLVTPQGPLDGGFRITAKGKRPSWMPAAVMTDGVRTFLTFPPSVTAGEAPALFALAPDGKAQLVNYRQQGGLWVVDRVLQAAELRVGGRRPKVVRIERVGAPS